MTLLDQPNGERHRVQLHGMMDRLSASERLIIAITELKTSQSRKRGNHADIRMDGAQAAEPHELVDVVQGRPERGTCANQVGGHGAMPLSPPDEWLPTDWRHRTVCRRNRRHRPETPAGELPPRNARK